MSDQKDELTHIRDRYKELTREQLAAAARGVDHPMFHEQSHLDVGWLLASLDAKDKELDAAWLAIHHGWHIEPRAYFEAAAPTNGFKYALAQAIHYLWKREVKERAQ